MVDYPAQRFLSWFGGLPSAMPRTCETRPLPKKGWWGKRVGVKGGGGGGGGGDGAQGGLDISGLVLQGVLGVRHRPVGGDQAAAAVRLVVQPVERQQAGDVVLVQVAQPPPAPGAAEGGGLSSAAESTRGAHATGFRRLRRSVHAVHTAERQTPRKFPCPSEGEQDRYQIDVLCACRPSFEEC